MVFIDKTVKNEADFNLGYFGPEWDEKIHDKDNPNFWKYGVANLVFRDLVKGKKSILDIGCGTGDSTLFLAEQTQLDYIVGIDLVKSMVGVAKHHASNRNLGHKTDFLVCDGMRLPFRQSCFDALVSRGDTFVFLLPQKIALVEFKRVLRKGAVVVIEIDNVRWKPGKIVSYSFAKMNDGTVAYSVEHFDVKRDHFKVFHILDPNGAIMKKIRSNDEFVRTGRLERRFPLKHIKDETIETKRGVVTHWPSLDEIRLLFTKGGFKDIEILGDGLLMGLLLDGDQKVTRAMKMRPELFFEIERKLIPFIDPNRAQTIILNAKAP